MQGDKNVAGDEEEEDEEEEEDGGDEVQGDSVCTGFN